MEGITQLQFWSAALAALFLGGLFGIVLSRTQWFRKQWPVAGKHKYNREERERRKNDSEDENILRFLKNKVRDAYGERFDLKLDKLPSGKWSLSVKKLDNATDFVRVRISRIEGWNPAISIYLWSQGSVEYGLSPENREGAATHIIRFLKLYQ